MLTKEQINTVQDNNIEAVFVPEWNGEVCVKGMSAIDANTLFLATPDGKNANMMGLVLVRCLCDEQGNRLYADDEAELIGKHPSKVLKPLLDVAMRLSGLGDEGLEKN